MDERVGASLLDLGSAEFATLAVFATLGALGLLWNVLPPLFAAAYALARPRRAGIERYLARGGDGGGGWFVVTGATEPLGAELARQLAERGCSVVVVGRRLAELEALRLDLLRHGRGGEKAEFIYHHMDFYTASPDDWAALAGMLASLPGGVAGLVNNLPRAGLHRLGRFEDMSLEALDSLVAVNVGTALQLSRMVVGDMIARRSGLILHTGSRALVPGPLTAVHSSCEAFLATLAQSLGRQLAPHSVDVRYLCVPDADDLDLGAFVASALRSVGRPGGARGPFYCSPSTSASLRQWLVDAVFGQAWAVRRLHRQQEARLATTHRPLPPGMVAYNASGSSLAVSDINTSTTHLLGR